jgi:uncharacterized zinc-type alcohol dehydrogenase-like protein
MSQTHAYAAFSADKPLAPFTFEHRQPRPDDVAIEILYSGVCHSDLHFARNDWGMTRYPLVPGHEIVGRVTAVGNEVSKFQVGDVVGVGCMVDSCRHCQPCRDGVEQYCLEGFTMTYGVIGMGGLGHMGVKLAKALGAEVTVFTRSESKVEEARRHGAHHVVVSTDEEQMAAVAETYDFMLDTVPVQHDLNPYLASLKYDGTHILVGLLEPIEPAVEAFNLVFKRRVLAGSLIGGIEETQELLDFCAEHDIRCDIEMIDMQDINTAFERMQKGDVRYRFVIDMASLKD